MPSEEGMLSRSLPMELTREWPDLSERNIGKRLVWQLFDLISITLKK
jgi:hypothetical protein